MFTGWFAGAMDQIGQSLGYQIQTEAQQVQSAAEDGVEFGLFQVSPI
ncbi:hypothetical protein [Shewanella marina]